MRAFISVELPDDIKEKIVGIVDTLKEAGQGVKWVEKKNLHITLKFLGWVPDEKIDNLKELVREAAKGHKIFNAKFEELGTFPPGKHPRVVWVGTSKGAEELKNIAISLEKSLSKAGYRAEEREFTAHITIGRVKEKKKIGELVKAIDSNKNAKFGETVVGEICIMKSTLTPKGPAYEVIEKVKLA